LTSGASSDIDPLASPDERYVFFSSNRNGSSQIWRMNADGTNKVQITKNEGGMPVFVSPDGHWIYFVSGLHQTVWRVSSEGGDETQVSSDRVTAPAFSRDGKYFAYFFRNQNDRRMLIAVESLDTKERVKTFALADDTFAQGRIAWLSDNRSFYYITTNGSNSELWRQSLDSNGPPKLLADM